MVASAIRTASLLAVGISLEIKSGSRHRVGGSWGQTASAQARARIFVHSPCGRPGCGGGLAVEAGHGADGYPRVTPRMSGVFPLVSQGHPQTYPQPVCVHCVRGELSVRPGRAHPESACCLMRLVSSVTWL